eukprot:scaffold113541_cov17-Tisochrysis_lutea.AAC.1
MLRSAARRLLTNGLPGFQSASTTQFCGALSQLQLPELNALRTLSHFCAQLALSKASTYVYACSSPGQAGKPWPWCTGGPSKSLEHKLPCALQGSVRNF